MANPKQKMKKIQPLIKIRKLQLDQETALLNQIQLKREEAAQALIQSQQTYIEGVEKLNQERQSSERKMLSALEHGVDYAKAQWYQRLMALRAVEEEERLQFRQVAEAQKRMKMLEHLDKRYLEQHIKQMNIQEQKQTDEFAISMNRRKVQE
jgi:flagellar biosynthesis chaperone FliJ